MALLALGIVAPGVGQPPQESVSGYAAARVEPEVDLLQPDAPLWAAAEVVEWGPPSYPTQFRALWSDDALLVRFDAHDPEPWHTYGSRDDPLWEEEVVEIFLDPDGDGVDYAELEINPANVVCDLRVRRGAPGVDADITWDLAGLRTRVTSLHDDADGRLGWTAVALVPWEALRGLPGSEHVSLPPRPGDRWRFNVFRIERPGGPEEPERDAVFAAWSPTTGPSFHDAGAFRELEFVDP